MANSAFLQRFLPPWTVITALTNGLSNQGYITNAAGTTTVNLPVTSAVGDVLYLATIQGDFILNVGVGQTVLLNSGVSSAAGTITSNGVGDNLQIVCAVADTTWVETSAGGTLSAV